MQSSLKVFRDPALLAPPIKPAYIDSHVMSVCVNRFRVFGKIQHKELGKFRELNVDLSTNLYFYKQFDGYVLAVNRDPLIEGECV